MRSMFFWLPRWKKIAAKLVDFYTPEWYKIFSHFHARRYYDVISAHGIIAVECWLKKKLQIFATSGYFLRETNSNSYNINISLDHISEIIIYTIVCKIFLHLSIPIIKIPSNPFHVSNAFFVPSNSFQSLIARSLTRVLSSNREVTP